ncbi:hypothetical protein [Actinoplanes sp. NPDC048796]|uniref:hypothetical protein n=1 Tax=Actinoplanes sp. NPDC048796 TaxID=3155640 RepID=UPI0033DC6B97
MITVLAVTAAEPRRGWGGPLAILVAFAVIGIMHLIKVRNENLKTPSPTPPKPLPRGAKTQVSVVSDTDDTDAGTGWWGSIVDLGDGRRVRRVKAVLATGSSRLPEDDEPVDGELVEDDIDLTLDEPAEPDSLKAWVAQNLGRLGYADLVREGMRLWQVSERTVKRRIADERQARKDSSR